MSKHSNSSVPSVSEDAFLYTYNSTQNLPVPQFSCPQYHSVGTQNAVEKPILGPFYFLFHPKDSFRVAIFYIILLVLRVFFFIYVASLFACRSSMARVVLLDRQTETTNVSHGIDLIFNATNASVCVVVLSICEYKWAIAYCIHAFLLLLLPLTFFPLCR